MLSLMLILQHRKYVQSVYNFFLVSPSVNHLVTLLQPADPRHLTARSGSIHVDDQVIFSHKHLQTAYNIPIWKYPWWMIWKQALDKFKKINVTYIVLTEPWKDINSHFWLDKQSVCNMYNMKATADLQEEVFHDVVVVWRATIRQVAGRENNDGIKAFAIITWWQRVQLVSE